MSETNRAIDLLALIKSKRAKVGVIGMGYVGGAVAYATSSCGLNTLGFDIDKVKINSINHLNNKNLSATNDISRISECDIICICVPTPLDGQKKPNLSILKDVLLKTSKHLHPGQLITIESSVAPGTTRNLALPILCKSQLKAGVDFFLSYSPERIDPSNKKFNIGNTPKLVAGLDKNSARLVKSFYSLFVNRVIPVTSLEIAEMTKVLENTFRLVNISLINEILKYTSKMKINIWEVISAASTKPYGFLAHYPGPGAGGDCIPVLPRHLLDNAKKQKVKLPVVSAAVAVNESQPKEIVEKAFKVINGKAANGQNPKVLLIGISYKAETSDIRESAALKIWALFEKSGASVSYHDPYVSNINGYSSQKLTQKLILNHDLVIITTAHKNIAYDRILKTNTPIIDTRNVFSKHRQPHIIKL